jgi:hypothetical protein
VGNKAHMQGSPRISLSQDSDHWGPIIEYYVDPISNESREKIHGFEHKYGKTLSPFALGLTALHTYTVDPTPAAKNGIYLFEFENRPSTFQSPRVPGQPAASRELVCGVHYKKSPSQYFYLTDVDACQVHMDIFPDALLEPVTDITVHSLPPK